MVKTKSSSQSGSGDSDDFVEVNSFKKNTKLENKKTVKKTRIRKVIVSSSSSEEGSDVENDKDDDKPLQRSNLSSSEDEEKSTNESSASEVEDSSDVETSPKRARVTRQSNKAESSRNNSVDVPSKKKTQKRKRKRAKKKATTPGGRRKIRNILREDDLREETKDAEKQEEERRQRLKELADDKIVDVDLDDSGLGTVPDPITKRLVLQKEPRVEVHPDITLHLKPHQVEGIKFIWDNLVESTSLASSQPGGGCILAHCMGLGKTLQTITVVHTILHCKQLPFKTVLVVAPLNTLLNWVAEFVRWVPDDSPVEIYNLTEYSTRKSRVQALNRWRNSGGVMVIGYDMFRLLATGKMIRHKATKVCFAEALMDPGPDIIVCDEGHKLKNSESNISITMNKVKTRRRLVLTGTPLQNNLVEYQCMVNFVKKDLLGTIKEFRNRFVNPIVNGQHSDSTKYDVRLMKNRCHILHEMLSGFVQRKDYTALAKYLCQKHEFILKIRLSPLQTRLYRHFLDTCTNRGSNPQAIVTSSRDTGLFADYQNLMRVWTHPRVLRLHTKRKELEEMNRYMDDSDEEEEASMTDDDYSQDKAKKRSNQTSEKNHEEAEAKEENPVMLISDESDDEPSKPNTRQTRRSKRMQVSDEEGESQEEEDEEEQEEQDDSSSEEEEEDDFSAEKSESDSSGSRKRGRRTRSTRYPLRGAEGRPAAPGKSPRRSRVLGGDSGSSGEDEKKTGGGGGDDDVQSKLDDSFVDDSDTWYSSVIAEEKNKFQTFGAGPKIMVLFEILRMARQCNDKVLVFSQSLLSLDLIEEMLAYSTRKTLPGNQPEDPGVPDAAEDDNEEDLPPGFHQSWYKNIDYFRMDGSSLGKSRQRWINEFNDVNDERARLFLISTKAGSLGVNLVAANRVVIFDVSWNPSHDIQSIFRVYRFGQTKTCYVYRLIAQGTMEEKIYDRQVTKQSLAFRVIDEQQINRHFTAHDLQELYSFNPLPAPEDDNELPVHALPKDELLAELLVGKATKRHICSFHQHDSLLGHQETEELTEEERKAAWEEYENEKKGLRNNALIRNQPQLQGTLLQNLPGASLLSGAGTSLGNVTFFPSSAFMNKPLEVVKLFMYHQRCGGVNRSQALNATDVRDVLLPALQRLPADQRKTANSCLNVMMKASFAIEESNKRMQSLKSVNLQELIETLKPLPMYRNMSELSIRMLALEVQIRQQQLRLAAEKERKNGLLQLKWYEDKLMKLFYNMGQSDAKAETPAADEVPANSDDTKTDALSLESASGFARLSYKNLVKECKQAGTTSSDRPSTSSSSTAPSDKAVVGNGSGSLPSDGQKQDANVVDLTVDDNEVTVTKTPPLNSLTAANSAAPPSGNKKKPSGERAPFTFPLPVDTLVNMAMKKKAQAKLKERTTTPKPQVAIKSVPQGVAPETGDNDDAPSQPQEAAAERFVAKISPPQNLVAKPAAAASEKPPPQGVAAKPVISVEPLPRDVVAELAKSAAARRTLRSNNQNPAKQDPITISSSEEEDEEEEEEGVGESESSGEEWQG